MNAEEETTPYLLNPATGEKTLLPRADSFKIPSGMTRLEFFAGCALIGILAHSPEKFARAAEDAFDYAEEMAREAKERQQS